MVERATQDERTAVAAPDARGTRLRRALRRVDPLPFALALASLLLSAGFVVVSLLYNGGRLIPPLDDVYIHLQYGRRLGLGEPFRYLPGEPVTSGASSLLYSFVLGSAYATGFHGGALLGFATGFGMLCVAAATGLTVLLGRDLGGRATGAWAGVLTCLSGPLLWGAASGMEVGLLALLLVGSVLAFVRERSGARFLVAPLVATLLALTRPEGLLTAGALVAGMVWTSARAAHAGRLPRARAARRAAFAGLPLLAGACQLLYYLLATGSAQANGVQAKSWLHAGLLRQPLEIADQTLRNAQQMIGSLSGLTGPDFAPPATLAFAVLGLVALAFRRERTLAVVLGGALAAVLLSVATLSTALWQDLRYLQPFLPLVLLLAVLGAGAVAGLATPDRGRVVLHGLLAVALLFTVVVTPTWAVRLGQQATAIREGPVSVAQWISGNVPPGDVVAVNDVGAAAWFGGHHTIDLVGLTTNGIAAPSLNGPGTLYEAVRALPPDRRPQWFAIFDEWDGVAVSDLGRAALLGAEPVITFELVSPPRPISAAAPQTCQIDRSCDRVSVWRADWSLDGSADLPDLPVAGTVRDHLNIGDMADEAVHTWAPQPPVLGLQPDSVLDRVAAPGRVVADSGRQVTGGETFTLRGLTPGRPVQLTGRIGADAPVAGEETRTVDVDVNGRRAGTWTLPEATPWGQASFTIPAELVTGPELTVSSRAELPFLAPYPRYRSYGWWVSQ